MDKRYYHLSAQERAVILIEHRRGCSLTGFGGGLPVKRFLLDHEQRNSTFTLS
ncbi:MAG TPA: hypothetical protein VFN13_10660 [Rudaea sp.]|nr:hypothetical protein [Rudaea sp.]